MINKFLNVTDQKENNTNLKTKLKLENKKLLKTKNKSLPILKKLKP